MFHMINGYPSKVQNAVKPFDVVRVFPRRVLYYVKLKWMYLVDAHINSRMNRVAVVQCTTPKVRSSILKWKEHLRQMQLVLDLFHFECSRETLLRRAEDIMRHRFHILGKSYRESDAAGTCASHYRPIAWHCDPGSDYQWSKHTWYRHTRIDLPPGVDIKVPWELSRAQHLMILGEAYRRTGESRYALEYRDQIKDWITNNPVRYGPNWTCTMDVGIRVANWVVSLLYFHTAPELDDAFFALLLQSLQEHGRHIMRNLENISVITSNHYIANISGLYVLAILCPVLKQSRKWKEFAKSELEKEVLKQVYDDGWHFEASTCYHKLVTEMLLYPFLLAEHKGDGFPEHYTRRLRMMIQVLGECAKPTGSIPQIGDNDSGRFLDFKGSMSTDGLNVRYLHDIAARNPKIAPKLDGAGSKFYPDAGRCLFKSRSIYLLITAGVKGQAGRGGHAHNDVLSYELSINGDDLIIDPGTYCYTSNPELRNKFRSVQSHNTLCWDGIEPCSLNSGLFRLPEEGILTVETHTHNKTIYEVSGLYKFKNRFHHRIIQVDKLKRTIKIIDKCSHQKAYLNLILAPNVKVNSEPGRVKLNNTWIEYQGIDSVKILPSDYSPEYGVKVPTNKIQLHLQDLDATQLIHY